MVQPKIEVNEFDLVILAGVARNQTLKEIAADLGKKKQVSFVQYRLNRLEQLGYVKSVPGKARSRYLTEKGQKIVNDYVRPEKRHDWREVAFQQQGD